MKLIGKRVERLNAYGDVLCIDLRDDGVMRLSPALISRLGVSKDNNKIGFGYDEDCVYVYTAPDGDGVAINKQGYIKNIPHNRDLRSNYNLPTTGEGQLYVDENGIEHPDYEGYTFYKIMSDTEEENPWDTEVEDVHTEASMVVEATPELQEPAAEPVVEDDDEDDFLF